MHEREVPGFAPPAGNLRLQVLGVEAHSGISAATQPVSGSEERLRERQTVNSQQLTDWSSPLFPDKSFDSFAPTPASFTTRPLARFLSDLAATFPLGRCLYSISPSCPLKRAVPVQNCVPHEAVYLPFN